LIAVGVLTLTLTGVSAVLGAQLVSIGASTAQQTANGLLTQAMEEVRALPYQFVVDGLSSSDSTISGDPNISVTGTAPNQTYTYKPTGETIPVSSPYSQAPFVPHISQKTVSGIRFQTAAYPTIDTDESGLYRVTIAVSWQPAHGVSSVSAETFVYSPSTGCLTDTNHPFAAPCQAFFYSQSSATSGSGLTVTGTVAGLNLTDIELLGPQASSSIQIEQSTSVLGDVKTSEADLSVLGVTQSVGGQSATSASDNDPGTRSPVSQSASTASQSGAQPLTLGSLLTTALTAIPGLGDEGTTTSTVDAASSPPCDDLAGHAQLTALPCGNSTVVQSGALASVSAELSAVGLPLVTWQPSSISSFVGRYASAGGSYCSATSGDGCVHAAASRSFGTLELAGLPALAGLVDPVGWGTGSATCPAGNYMVGLVGYSDQASAESGVGASAPGATVNSAHLCYWNGTTYQALSVSLGSTPDPISIPTLSIGIPAIAAVTITPSISFGQTTTMQNTPSGCSSACTASSVITSPISGTLEVSVVVLGQTVADLTIGIDLGNLDVRTSYQAAP